MGKGNSINGQNYIVWYYHVLEGTTPIPSGTIGLRLNGQDYKNASPGVNSLDALCNAVDKITGVKIRAEDRIVNYDGHRDFRGFGQIHSYTAIVKRDGLEVTAVGRDFDKYKAALMAYVNAINKIRVQEKVQGTS